MVSAPEKGLQFLGDSVEDGVAEEVGPVTASGGVPQGRDAEAGDGAIGAVGAVDPLGTASQHTGY